MHLPDLKKKRHDNNVHNVSARAHRYVDSKVVEGQFHCPSCKWEVAVGKGNMKCIHTLLTNKHWRQLPASMREALPKDRWKDAIEYQRRIDRQLGILPRSDTRAEVMRPPHGWRIPSDTFGLEEGFERWEVKQGKRDTREEDRHPR